MNYIRAHIPRVAQLTQSLMQKVKKDFKWYFSKEDEEIEQKIKLLRKNLSKLEYSKAVDNVILETDASDSHWSGVLKAINPEQEKTERICGYASRTFKASEKNYCALEKEIVATKNSITFKIHLLPKIFLIRTDSNFSGFWKSNLHKAMNQTKMQRWQAWFSEWQFKVEHIQGKLNCLPDALTREMACVLQEMNQGKGKVPDEQIHEDHAQVWALLVTMLRAISELEELNTQLWDQMQTDRLKENVLGTCRHFGMDP